MTIPRGSSGRDRRHVGDRRNGARPALQHGIAEHLVGLGMLRQGDHRAPGADDARLLARDLAQGVSQEPLVVEGDVGDDGDAGLDHVGGVQPAAHAHLEHREVHCALGEVVEGHSGQHLEKAGMPGQVAARHQLGGHALHALVQGGELGVADGLPVHLQPLVDLLQVRRSVEGGAVAGGAQDRGQGGGGRAFAVGPGDQHRGEAALRVAQRGQQHAHVRQVELGGGSLVQFVPQLQQLRHCPVVGHGWKRFI